MINNIIFKNKYAITEQFINNIVVNGIPINSFLHYFLFSKTKPLREGDVNGPINFLPSTFPLFVVILYFKIK